jgi:hypothetical protein
VASPATVGPGVPSYLIEIVISGHRPPAGMGHQEATPHIASTFAVYCDVLSADAHVHEQSHADLKFRRGICSTFLCFLVPVYALLCLIVSTFYFSIRLYQPIMIARKAFDKQSQRGAVR